MSDQPGKLLASGRAADVYDCGDGTVLRRYRADHDSELEVRAMTWILEQGIRVPRVHHVTGRDIVMDLIEGPTMLQDLEARPWLLFSHMRTLATIQRELNALAAPDWFPTRTGVAPGRCVLHLDLHPMNVLLSPSGPTIIDWTNASKGSAAFDAAVTYVLMSSFEAQGLRDRVAQILIVAAFSAARGRRLVRSALGEAARYRLLDKNTTDGERIRLRRMADR